MAQIQHITAREILDSKGNPTIETTVVLSDLSKGVASVPCGTSVGTYEAKELRDRDDKRFRGLGVLRAIDNIENKIAPAIIGIEANKQSEIDRKMIDLDGTETKSNLGANAILSVSIAVAKAAANSFNVPLYRYLHEFTSKENKTLKIPIPLFNLINGGKHAGMNVDMQEFHVIPATFKSYRESLQIGTSVYATLKTILTQNNQSTLIGDEGGYGPVLPTNEDALNKLSQAVSLSNLRPGYDVFFGIDAAASSFYQDKHYKIKDKDTRLNATDLLSFYSEITKKYKILYLEDALAEDDWEGWQVIGDTIGKDTIVTGDDLTATNPYRLQMALEKKAISGIIIKPNQIGSVIESLAVVEVARNAGLKIIVSHRSGETNDDFIADFAVGVSADYTKLGAPARGERIAKYNRLLQIDDEIKAMQ